MLRKSFWFASLSIFYLILTSFISGKVLAAPPSDFEKIELVSGLQEPTSYRFLPDGRIFISEKTGAIKVVENGSISPDPVVTMVTLQTDSRDERGVLGIEPDLDFANNGYLYVAYTSADNRDRLSRITVVGNNADLSSEVVLLESDQDANIYHHGGELRFGPDGKLYWASGMNSINENSQLLTNIHGKILRLNKDGSIPADNPLLTNPTANQAIWAYGLRNPFRFDFLPNGKIITGDVGGSSWEEVNIIEKGANYGWPLVEGTCTDCSFANPIFTYHHTPPPEKSGSITAAMYYDSDVFPPQYKNTFFYGDYTIGFIRYLVLDENQESVLSDNLFDDQAGAVVQLEEGPDGNIYQLNFYPGSLYKISLSDGNRAPIAEVSANPVAGTAPLSVSFSSAGSYDPDGSPLSYDWDFQDGTTSSESNPTHVFENDGQYSVVLTVSDGVKTAEQTVLITVGNNLPQPTITSPTADSKYNAGDTITFTGSATDEEDGDLPDTAYTWTFLFHHGTHTHPFNQTITGAKTGTFTIPTSVDNQSNTWYGITLTVTDSGGLQQSTTTYIYPNLVNLTFTSNTPELQYTIDGIPFTGTHTEEAVVGVERVISGISPQFLNGEKYRFEKWSDNGPLNHTIHTLDSDTTFQVSYKLNPLPQDPWKIALVDNSTGDSGYADGEYYINAASTDIWGTEDGMYYVYQTLDGDGEIVARIASQSRSDEWAKAGVMIRETASQFSPYTMMAVTPDHGYAMQWQYANAVSGMPYTFPNAWVKLVRTGDVITGYISNDGITWTEVASDTIPMSQQVTIGLFNSSHHRLVASEVIYEDVVVTSSQNNATLPQPWNNTDIGSPALSGGAQYDSNTGSYTIEGGGSDIWGDTDEFHYVSQPLTGDGEIVARVASQSRSDGWAKAGVMIKGSAASQSPYAMMAVTPDYGYRYQADFTDDAMGGNYAFPNAWVKLVRTGTVITGYVSSDGVSWEQVAYTTVNLQDTATFGLFVTAHSTSSLSTVTFDNVSVQSGISLLPNGWQSSDIGSPTVAGTTMYDANTDTYTIDGGGRDIWGGTDEFHFAYKTLSGDGEIVARVTSQTRAAGWSKAGVMIKGSADPHTPYALMAVTPDYGYRYQADFTDDAMGGNYAFPNAWVKLVRTGTNITGYVSPDGLTWSQVASTQVDLGSTATFGLFSTAHTDASLSTATFDNVAIQSTLPSEWSSTDIGSPTLAGSAQYDSNTGVFTIEGGGNDIWGTTDEFHYVYKPLTGDGEIIARVTSQTVSNGWAKAGVMIKESSDAMAPYAMMAVTPDYGYRYQADFTDDAGGGNYTFPNSWVKLVRTGTTVTGYVSTDGINWTQVASTNVSLSPTATVGLFVTGHSSSTKSTVTIDNVTVQ